MNTIQNIDDNAYFKWCLERCLHTADHHIQELQEMTNILKENSISKI